jgi:murein DD-endopeptidase MepM/ murein hydrolase activator NlpD
MKVILISGKHGGSRTLELGKWSRALVSLCCLGLPLGLLALGFQAGQERETHSLRGAALDNLQSQLKRQSGELRQLQALAERRLQAMTVNLAELQARMTRLDALGEHLTVMADLEGGEFDFSEAPAPGGPVSSVYNSDFSAGDVTSELARFEARLTSREQQLDVLESLLTNRKLREQRHLSGLPVSKGWVSSGYGKRVDPFSGKQSFHKGVDIAGKSGTEVVAVAAGVVTWTGKRPGYGNMVEVSHGDGYITRYAHNKANLVEPGDLVRKGETIALMGSSGRATGAHVHYEVYKNGRSVDPSSYLARTRQR